MNQHAPLLLLFKTKKGREFAHTFEVVDFLKNKSHAQKYLSTNGAFGIALNKQDLEQIITDMYATSSYVREDNLNKLCRKLRIKETESNRNYVDMLFNGIIHNDYVKKMIEQ